MKTRFRDRREAGRLLAGKLANYAGQPGLLVLGLPRGGVPVASELAKGLRAGLDVFLVRKLGVPGHEELAMGAISTGGVRALNREVIDLLRIPDDVIEAVARREQKELERREKAYRDGRPPPSVRGRTVIVVDDGIATGSTMRAAIMALKEQEAGRIVVATPTAALETAVEIKRQVDEFVALMTPAEFHSVGEWYESFNQTTDEEVRAALQSAERRNDGTWLFGDSE